MWLSYLKDLSVLGVPLWVILLCGILGVLIDADHLIAYFSGGRLSPQFLHTPLLIISGSILLGCGAYLGGLLLRSFLK